MINRPVWLERPLNIPDGGGVEYERNSLFAGGVAMNAVSIKLHRHWNGSGKDFFGGAKSWPHLTLELSFQVGEEHLRDDLGERLKKFVDDYLTELGR